MSKRKPVVGTGWKLYVNYMEEAKRLLGELRIIAEEFPEVETFVFPEAPQLPIAEMELKGSCLGYGLQHICVEEAGGYTGENSIELLKDLGGEYVEIGHAERRGMYHESDSEVNLKMRLCQRKGIKPVVCVGEKEEDIVKKQNRLALKSQCLWAFDQIDPKFFENIILTYEPVWAIGKSSPANAEYVQEVHSFLRECIEKEHGKEAAEAIRIMYGGSNSPKTTSSFIVQPDIDGLFVGRSALNTDNFREIVQIVANSI